MKYPQHHIHSQTQVRFANEVHDFVTSPEFEFVGLENEDNHENSPNPRRLRWNLDSESINAISDATKRANDLISSVDYAVIQSDAINSSWAKSNKLSPDGLLQMIMQLAHYRLKGRAGSTYESATTAAFKHGRTETIRSVTPESLAMCEAFFDESKSNVDKEKLLRDAVNNHSKVTMRALKGQGMDRHMFVLRHMALQKCNGDESRLPAIFQDPAWHAMSNIILSTSTLPSPALKGGGFGPVGDDCYAIGYGVRELGCQFSVMTSFNGAQEFADSVGECISDVKRVILSKSS